MICATSPIRVPQPHPDRQLGVIIMLSGSAAFWGLIGISLLFL